MSNFPLLDQPVGIRTKLALMWCAVMFLYVYGDYFELYIPGEATNLVNGKTLLDTPAKVFGASLLMSIPPLVILVSVAGAARIARWANIIFGSLFTFIMMFIAVTSLAPEWAAYVFYAITESIITIMIVAHAWKWPRQIAKQFD